MGNPRSETKNAADGHDDARPRGGHPSERRCRPAVLREAEAAASQVEFAAALSLLIAGAGSAEAQTRYYAREKVMEQKASAQPAAPARICSLTAGKYMSVNPDSARYSLGTINFYGRSAEGQAAGKAACEADPKAPQACWVAEMSSPSYCGGRSPCSTIFAAPKGVAASFQSYGNDAAGICS